MNYIVTQVFVKRIILFNSVRNLSCKSATFIYAILVFCYNGAKL
jgi:hypothetical protein